MSSQVKGLKTLSFALGNRSEMLTRTSPFSVLQLIYMWVFWATSNMNYQTMDVITDFTFLVQTLMALRNSRKTYMPKRGFALKEELFAFHATGSPDTLSLSEFNYWVLAPGSSLAPIMGFLRLPYTPTPSVVPLLKIREFCCCIKSLTVLSKNK